MTRRSATRRTRVRRGLGLMRFFILMAAVGAIGLTILVLTASAGAGTEAAAIIGTPAPGLNPIESWLLSTYLLIRLDDLQEQSAIGDGPIAFAVVAGESGGDVAVRLEALHIVSDARLLRVYMRYNGIDGQIEAGNFQFDGALTIPQVAYALTDALPTEITVRVWEGWRSEQIAEALAGIGHFDFSRERWDALVQRQVGLPAAYAFLDSLPEGATLEGYLFPDSYRFLPDASVEEIVDRMLRTFAERAAPELPPVSSAGLTPHQVVTLASIVEREAVKDAERPLIASVFLNRIALGMRLDADPTTQYALAAPGNWWPALSLDPRLVESPYNTYIVTGLPPGPIANPGLASIRAVLNPAHTDYLYFRATCAKDGFHNFSFSYEEHLSNACTTSTPR